MKKAQFCKRGHDTFICGRTKRMCNLCIKESVTARSKTLKHRETCKKYYQEHKILKVKETVLDTILQRDQNTVIHKRAGIYRIFCFVDGKVYIGSSKNLGKRFQHHREAFIQNTNSPHLQNAWNKYGPHSFKFEVLEFVDSVNVKIIREREQFWMDYYESYFPDKGYNICKKADGSEVSPRTQEHKDKISATLKKKYTSGELVNAFLGHKHTEEYKQRDSEMAKKLWSDPTYKDKMIGIFNSPETLQKKIKILEKARSVQKELRDSKKI